MAESHCHLRSCGGSRSGKHGNAADGSSPHRWHRSLPTMWRARTLRALRRADYRWRCPPTQHAAPLRRRFGRGYVLACQAVVEGDVDVHVPPQETLERRLTTDRTVAEVAVPAGYNAAIDQPLQRILLTLPPPSMDDQTDDWSRLQTALRQRRASPSCSCHCRCCGKSGRCCVKGNGGSRPFSIPSAIAHPARPGW